MSKRKTAPEGAIILGAYPSVSGNKSIYRPKRYYPCIVAGNIYSITSVIIRNNIDLVGCYCDSQFDGSNSKNTSFIVAWQPRSLVQ